MSKKDSLGTDIGKLAVKGLKKLGVKAKKEKKGSPKKKDKAVKSGRLGSGAAQKAANKLKSHEQRTHDAIRKATGGKERRETKGRR